VIPLVNLQILIKLLIHRGILCQTIHLEFISTTVQNLDFEFQILDLLFILLLILCSNSRIRFPIQFVLKIFQIQPLSFKAFMNDITSVKNTDFKFFHYLTFDVLLFLVVKLVNSFTVKIRKKDIVLCCVDSNLLF